MSEKYYYDRKQYVEVVLDATLSPMQDFDNIRYSKDAVTDKEYIRLADQIGGCVFLDVTAEPLGEVLKDVSRIVLNDELEGAQFPKNIVSDIETKRKVAPLFR